MGTLDEGAKNAVEVCMGVKPGEHVMIVTDRSSLDVGNALKNAAQKVTSHVSIFILEDYGSRPMQSLPKEIKKVIPEADVTFWAAQSREGELSSLRAPFMKIALKYARHGHMPSANKKLMEEGWDIKYLLHDDRWKPEWKKWLTETYESMGIKVIEIPYYKGKSTTGIINKILRREK